MANENDNQKLRDTDGDGSSKVRREQNRRRGGVRKQDAKESRHGRTSSPVADGASDRRDRKRGVAAGQNRPTPKSGQKNGDVRRQQKADRRVTNPRELVVETLIRMEEGGFSNIVWDLAVRHADLSPLDRMLATRIYYGTLSNMRLIDALWHDIEPDMARRADSVVKMALRSAMYQLVFLDRVPAYSIVSTTVDVVKRMRNHAASGYCNALLRKAVRRQESEEGLGFKPTGDMMTDFAVKYSFGDGLAGILVDRFGPDADEIAESMNSVPRMVLRVNRSRVSMEEFASRPDIKAEPLPLMPDTACAVTSRHEAVDAALDSGEVCVQDEAAQYAVAAMGSPETWDCGRDAVHIWDACAGMGGKSIHILDEIARAGLGGRYSLLSTDLYTSKLEKLRDYHRKFFNNLHLITKARDLTIPGSVTLAPFDAILVDAPCSGLGVLRRHPEIKYARTPEDIRELAALQAKILDNVCPHLRPGGVMVYAVCTFTREECEDQVEGFLKRHPNFRASALPQADGNQDGAAWRMFLPSRDGCDGFFVARFVREK